jgi:hypothetical protein
MALRALLVAALAAGQAVDLNPGNFKESLAGKNSFIKFLAPW